MYLGETNGVNNEPSAAVRYSNEYGLVQIKNIYTATHRLLGFQAMTITANLHSTIPEIHVHTMGNLMCTAMWEYIVLCLIFAYHHNIM